jgi:hypothetical protein
VKTFRVSLRYLYGAVNRVKIRIGENEGGEREDRRREMSKEGGGKRKNRMPKSHQRRSESPIEGKKRKE